MENEQNKLSLTRECVACGASAEGTFEILWHDGGIGDEVMLARVSISGKKTDCCHQPERINVIKLP